MKLFLPTKEACGSFTYSNEYFFRASGLIVGGLDRGFISVYDASKLLNGNGDNALVLSKDKHTGQVTFFHC